MHLNNKIGFDLGYQVQLKDKTDFHRQLVELFGEGGAVVKNRKCEVEKFNVIMDLGVLALNPEQTALVLEIRHEEFGGKISSVDINALHQKLKDAGIIKSENAWYIESVATFEAV